MTRMLNGNAPRAFLFSAVFLGLLAIVSSVVLEGQALILVLVTSGALYLNLGVVLLLTIRYDFFATKRQFESALRGSSASSGELRDDFGARLELKVDRVVEFNRQLKSTLEELSRKADQGGASIQIDAGDDFYNLHRDISYLQTRIKSISAEIGSLGTDSQTTKFQDDRDRNSN